MKGREDVKPGKRDEEGHYKRLGEKERAAEVVNDG